jgi:hypothetical protein
MAKKHRFSRVKEAERNRPIVASVLWIQIRSDPKLLAGSGSGYRYPEKIIPDQGICRFPFYQKNISMKSLYLVIICIYKKNHEDPKLTEK